MDDDTFSDSDSSSGDNAFTGAFIGASMGSSGSGRSNEGGCAAAILVIIIVLLVIVALSSGDNHHGERREQQTKAMIEAWAKSMSVTVVGHSCKHEKSRALCDVRLMTGDTKRLQCGKGGCSER